LKTNAKRRVPDPTNPFGNPLGFGLSLKKFGTEVLALQSVTSWCQNWSSGVPHRREAPAEKMSQFSYFLAKSENRSRP
jgi:hypothetical protein